MYFLVYQGNHYTRFLMACKKALSQVYNFEIVICFLIKRQLIVFKALLKKRLMIEKSVFLLEITFWEEFIGLKGL